MPITVPPAEQLGTASDFLDAPSPTAVSGTGKVFGLNMDGSVDTTDDSALGVYNSHHGAYADTDLTDPNLVGLAIGGHQAAALTGISDPEAARQSLLGKFVHVTNDDSGKSALVRVVDKAPLGQAHVEMTPAAHALVGSNGDSNLSLKPASAEDFLGRQDKPSAEAFLDAPSGPQHSPEFKQWESTIDQRIQDSEKTADTARGQETDPDVLQAMKGTLEAQNDMGILTQFMRENWEKPVPQSNELPNIVALRTGKVTHASEMPDPLPDSTVAAAMDSLRAGADYAAPGFLPQLDNALEQLHVPESAVRQFMSDFGNQFGGAGIARLLPAGVQRADAGLGESIAEQVSGLTSPDNIKILGAMALLPGAAEAEVAKRALSLGFGAQAAAGMAGSIKQAAAEKDPQEFWKQVGNAVTQGAVATLATAHGVRSEPITSPAAKSVPETVRAEDISATGVTPSETTPIGLEQRLPVAPDGSDELAARARPLAAPEAPSPSDKEGLTGASDAPAGLPPPSPTKTSETLPGIGNSSSNDPQVTSEEHAAVAPMRGSDVALIDAIHSGEFAEGVRDLISTPAPKPQARYWTVIGRDQLRQHVFTDFATADTYMRDDAVRGERLVESAPGEQNVTLPYGISSEQARSRGRWTQTALQHFVETGEITEAQAREAGLQGQEPGTTPQASPVVAERNEPPIPPQSPLHEIAGKRSATIAAVEAVASNAAEREFIANLSEQARASLGPGAASADEFPLIRAENAREYATIGASHLLEGKSDKASWTAAMREEYGVRDATDAELNKIWRDAHGMVADFHASQRGKALRPRAQIEQTTGIRPALASAKARLADAVSKAEALSGYLRGMEAGGKLGAQARQRQLAIADKWLAADQEQVRQTLTNFVKASLPLSERGRYLGAITRALKRPDLVRGDPAVMYRNAFRVMQAIENRGETVHRSSLIADIRKVSARILKSPTVDLAAKRILQRTLREIELRSQSPSKLESLGKTREFLNRMAAAGKDVVLPKNVQVALERLGRRSIQELPTASLEDMRTKVRLAEKIGHARFRTRGAQWEAEKKAKLDELSAGDGTPLELREMFRPQPGERLTLGDKVRNWTARAFNANTAFDLGHLPMDVHFDLLQGGKGTYAGPLFDHIRTPVDAAYDRAQYRAIRELDPLREIIRHNKLSDVDEDLIGLWAQLQQEGGEKRAMESGVTKATIDKLKAKGLTRGQKEAYDYMRSRLDATLPDVQTVMHELFNIDVEAVENYFPWQRDWVTYKPPVDNPVFDARTGAKVSPEMLESFGKIAGDFVPRDTPKLQRGFTIERQEGAKTPIRTDSFDVFQKHMYAASRLIEMQRELKMAGEIIRDPAFARKFGDYGQKMLNDWLSAVATDGRGKNVHRMPLLDMARRGSNRALVFFRLTSNIKHLSAVPQAIVNSGGPEYYYRGLHAMFSKQGGAFLKQFPQVTERQAGDMSLQELQRSMGNTPSGLFPKGLAYADRFGFILGKEIDALNSRAVFLGRYLRNLEDRGVQTGFDGPIDQAAASNALAFMRRTVSSTLAKDVQPVLGRGQGFGGNVSIARTMNAFRQYALERWSLLRYDTPAAFKSGNYTRGVALLAAALAAGLYETNVGAAVKHAGALLAGHDDSNDREHESWLERLMVDSFSMVPYANNVVSAVQWGETGIPLADNFVRAGEAVKHVATAKTDEGKKSAAIGAAGAAATLGGVPGSGVATALARKALVKDPKKSRQPPTMAELDEAIRRQQMATDLGPAVSGR